jgi:hypothetical protein
LVALNAALTGLIIAHGTWPALDDLGRMIHVGPAPNSNWPA